MSFKSVWERKKAASGAIDLKKNMIEDKIYNNPFIGLYWLLKDTCLYNYVLNLIKMDAFGFCSILNIDIIIYMVYNGCKYSQKKFLFGNTWRYNING